MGRIKVLFLIGQLGLGGSERQLFLLLRHFDHELFECKVIVFNPSPYLELSQAIGDLGVSVITIPNDIQGVWSRSRYLCDLFRQWSPHIVHSWTIHDNPYAGIIGWLAGIPIRWGSVRGSITLRDFQRLPKFYRWLSLRSTPKLVVNSKPIKTELEEAGISNSKILVLPNCVELEASSNSVDLSLLGIKKTDLILGNVGNLRRVKNQTMFIDLVAGLIEVNPKIRGLIVGQSIPQEKDWPLILDNQIENLGLSGKVILTGFRPDVSALMQYFSVLCVTSKSEGTPNVIMEAMAASKPVVATRVGGVPALVKDGVSGFLVEPGDVDGFAGAVLELLENPDLAVRMGRVGREIAEREFNPERAVETLTGLYLKALSQKGLRTLTEADAN